MPYFTLNNVWCMVWYEWPGMSEDFMCLHINTCIVNRCNNQYFLQQILKVYILLSCLHKSGNNKKQHTFDLE